MKSFNITSRIILNFYYVNTPDYYKKKVYGICITNYITKDFKISNLFINFGISFIRVALKYKLKNGNL